MNEEHMCKEFEELVVGMKPHKIDLLKNINSSKRHPKCRGYYDYWGDFYCEYQTDLECDKCKYGGHGGRKDPEAKCNQL